MTTAQRIRQCRQKAGLSQEKVAESLGVSRQAVTKWETGQSAPSTDNLFRLAALFGTGVDLLLEQEGGPSPAQEMYRLLRAEEAEKALALRQQKRQRQCAAALVVLLFAAVYLLGRLLWCRESTSVLGFLWQVRPTGQHSYLFGWLLSSRLFWAALAVSALPALWGKRTFSLGAAAGFVLALALGILLGPTHRGTGEYGWAYWLMVFLASLVMSGILQRFHSRGGQLRSPKGRLLLLLFAAAILAACLFVGSAIPAASYD